jgi:hypothetical protein
LSDIDEGRLLLTAKKAKGIEVASIKSELGSGTAVAFTLAVTFDAAQFSVVSAVV